MEELTTTEKQCYNSLVFLIRENGYPPTLRELADFLNKTHPTVLATLKRLRKKGWVEKIPKISRGTYPQEYLEKTQDLKYV